MYYRDWIKHRWIFSIMKQVLASISELSAAGGKEGTQQSRAVITPFKYWCSETIIKLHDPRLSAKDIGLNFGFFEGCFDILKTGEIKVPLPIKYSYVLYWEACFGFATPNLGLWLFLLNKFLFCSHKDLILVTKDTSIS